MNKLNYKTKASSCLSFLFVFFVFSTLYAQEVKLYHGGEPMYNIDLPGSDIYHFTLDAPPPGIFDFRQGECAKACWDNDDCLAWTYVRPNTIQGPKGNCWLKNYVPAKRYSKCCVSGTIGEANIDRPGSDYIHFNTVSPQRCQEICYFQYKCMAWTWVKPNTFQGPKGVCWLKDTIPPIVKNNSCVSGYFTIGEIK